jgi:prepilin peptidase CpaA
MALTEVGRWAVAILFTGLLGWASISDIRVRKIPNWTVLAILGLFAPWAVLSTSHWVVWALAAGAIALIVSVILYMVGMVGAGDSKLFAAVALFVGMSHLPHLALGTALVGGAIAAVSILTRPRRAMVMLTMRGKGDFGRGIPYGVAIAAAAVAIVWINLLNLPISTSILDLGR